MNKSKTSHRAPGRAPFPAPLLTAARIISYKVVSTRRMARDQPTETKNMSIPNHLFVSDDGGLYDTRQENWSETPLRRNYSRHPDRIETAADVKAALRAGPYVWPGGYQLAFFAIDGALICFDCARENLFQMFWSIRDDIRDGWKPAGLVVVDDFDDADHECCAHCSKPFND